MLTGQRAAGPSPVAGRLGGRFSGVLQWCQRCQPPKVATWFQPCRGSGHSGLRGGRGCPILPGGSKALVRSGVSRFLARLPASQWRGPWRALPFALCALQTALEGRRPVTQQWRRQDLSSGWFYGWLPLASAARLHTARRNDYSPGLHPQNHPRSNRKLHELLLTLFESSPFVKSLRRTPLRQTAAPLQRPAPAMATTMQAQAPPSKYVTLVSADGFEFVVLREATLVSPILKGMLDPRSA